MKQYIFALIFCPIVLQAQVGIGTVEPTAFVEIQTEPTGVAGLRLQPQTNPKGSATGQMAVMDDMLYLYDAVRGSWLSAEETTLEYGRLGTGSAPAEIEFGGGDLQNGPRMPFDGTIVSVFISATQNPLNREIFLFKNGIAVPNNDSNPAIDGEFNLSPIFLVFENSNYNLEFSKGDMLSLQIDSAVNDIDNLIVNLKVKWRKENP